MNETATQTTTGYNVIIDSIGAGSPAAAQILAESLGLPVEATLRLLYNTPALMFKDVEEKFADEAVSLLLKLGLEVRKKDSTQPLPKAPSMVDVGIYIHEPSLLPAICNELSLFIGCPKKDALNLLMQEPCIVLGNVSEATAEALRKRINAEVFISTPKSDQYSLRVKKDNPQLKKQLIDHLNYLQIEHDVEHTDSVGNLDYEESQAIWRKYHGNEGLQIINESFIRYEIVLYEVDTSNPQHRTFLTEEIGMPDVIIDEVLLHLPIQLEASVHSSLVDPLIYDLEDKGLTCEAIELPICKQVIQLQTISDLPAVQKMLGQFFAKEKLPQSEDEIWASPPLGDLMTRFIAEQLELLNCDVTTEIHADHE